MSKPKAPSVDPFGGDPIEGGPHIVSCPVCASTQFEARQNQYTTWRICQKCGNEWSGGVAGQPDFTDPDNMKLVPSIGLPAPDEVEPYKDDPHSFRGRGQDRGWGGE